MGAVDIGDIGSPTHSGTVVALRFGVVPPTQILDADTAARACREKAVPSRRLGTACLRPLAIDLGSEPIFKLTFRLGRRV
jgi:hypothetical protein